MDIQKVLLWGAGIAFVALMAYCAFTGEKITNYIDKKFILDLLDRIKEFK